MPGEETKMENKTPVKKEFGFVVAQTVTQSTTLPEIEKSINNFFEEMGGRLAKKCHIKMKDIETRIHYNGRKNILEGQSYVPKETGTNVIDSLYNQGKAIWRKQPTEPHRFSLFTVDKPDCKDDNDDMGGIGWRTRHAVLPQKILNALSLEKTILWNGPSHRIGRDRF